MADFACDIPESAEVYTCGLCGRTFASEKAKRTHKIDVHFQYRKLLAKERPTNRGPIPCGVLGCASSFRTEHNARQHRLMKHGIVKTPLTET